MRGAFFVAFVAILGCGRPVETPVAAPASIASSSESSPRDADEEAAFALDTACASLTEARSKTQSLSTRVGDEAGEALKDVLIGLDAAGEALSDQTDPPPEGRAFTDREREEARKAANDALAELQDVGDILDNLAQNAPPEHERTVAAIRVAVDEAEDSVQEALDGLKTKG